MALLQIIGNLQIQKESIEQHAVSTYQPVSASIKTDAPTSNYRNCRSALAFCQTNDSATKISMAKNTAPAVSTHNTQRSNCNRKSSNQMTLALCEFVRGNNTPKEMFHSNSLEPAKQLMSAKIK